MSALDQAAARDLLLRVVKKFYDERHSPIPGALVKARLVAEAQEEGAEFSEQQLGFKKFIEFVRTVPEVAIQGRSGSDVLLAPVTASELLAAYATSLPRLRRDFWRAFVEFPVENAVRLYDPAEDKILYEPKGTQRQGVPIEPVSRKTQLPWRKIFSEEQPETIKDSLLAAVNGAGTTVFNEFARRLRENPSVTRAWNHYLQKQITDCVASWAKTHDIPEERWLAPARRIQFFRSEGEMVAAKPQSLSQRAELYNFFDQLPIEDLLQLRVPLEWVLKVTQRGDT
jgi:hypothetical protein